MSRSVVYRERDSDTRAWEEPQKRTYTTVKRYQVPDPTSKSSLGAPDDSGEKIIIRREKSAQPLRSPESDYRHSDRHQDSKPRDDIDIRITERSTREQPQPRQDDDWRYSERTYQREPEPKRDVTYRVVERERENDYDDRRSSARGGFEYRADYSSNYHVERDRQSVRAPSPPRDTQVREFRFERDRERDWGAEATRRQDDSYEIERYSKDTEYYQPQPIVIRERAPQPIIIREREPQPIIIREERREPQYEFIERREVEEERQLVRREEPPPPAPRSEAPRSVAPPQPQQEEDYFYERRVVERNREPRRGSDSHDRRSEIRPRDSASNYSSDGSYEHVKRTTVYEDDDRDSHHRRHLAEGAAVGAAAGALINHHRNSERGEKGGTIKSTVGGAALGGLATEAVSRWRSRSRRRGSGSGSRDRSNETRRDRRSRRHDRSDSRGRDRSESRSKSLSRKQLAGLAGVAAVGAAVGYAINKRNKEKNETIIINDRSPTRRSRSRRRQGSEDSYMMDERLREDDKHRDPDHRNRRIAQAGLASAAAAGIFERVRSKSRGGKGRERSKSRVRQGVPIAAAGLGGAALAGLYEKNKASKEAKRDAIIADETSRGRRHRSRSRSRSVPASRYDDQRSIDTRDMVAYGDDPIPRGERGYYSDDDAPGNYRRRHGGSSASSMSPDRRKRSRSRNRNLAGMGAAAGLGGLAAHEYGKRSERKRNERDAQRREDEGYDNGYAPSPGPYDDPPSGYLPPQQNAGYNAQQTYPGSTYFPPPPTAPENVYADPAYATPAQQQAADYPPYNPADYAQPSGATPQQNYPYNAARGGYGDSDANLGAPYGHETFAGDGRYAAPEQPATPLDERRRGRDPPNNVSAPNTGSATANTAERQNDVAAQNERETQDAGDGVRTPRARSSSRVRFDLNANEAHSPETRKKTLERDNGSEQHGDRTRRHRHKHDRRSGGKERERERGDRDDDDDLMHDKYERPPASSTASTARGGRRHRRDDDEGSEGTVDLPDRFDSHGNRKPEGDGIEALLGSLASRFLGGGDEDEDSGRSGRRRHRH